MTTGGQRSVVVDLADADFLRRVDDAEGVRCLTEGVAALRPAARPVAVGCPSTWGRPRRERLEHALQQVMGPVPLVPRAELIAASHADAVTGSCAVVEALIIPGERAGASPAAWSVQRLARSGGTWQAVDVRAGELGEAELAAGAVPAALLDAARGADAVFVDGPDAGELTDAVAGALPDTRVVEVDRALVERHGGRALGRTEGFSFAPAPESARRRLPRVLLGATVAVVLALGAAGVVARLPRPPVAEPVALERVGPARLAIPSDWRRTELSGDRPDDGRGLRAVFADGGDGRRLIVVVTGLRPGATSSSVAKSLRNRIAQRGDEVVVEFAADANYAGRTVISYREAPESGAAVRWYVVVEETVQLSVGCQPGTGDAPIDPPCRGAVATIAVGD